MTYAFACLYAVLYLIRPTDLIPGLTGFPIFHIVGGMGILSLLATSGRSRTRPFQNVTDLMMFGYVLAMGASQVANGWAGGALQTAIDFSPVLVGYLLIAHGIDSEARWKRFYWILIACSALIVIECAQQQLHGISFLGVEPMIQRVEASGNEEAMTVLRVRWTGPFNDPNDLAMLFAFPMPFLANNILERRRWPSLPLLGLLAYGIVLTQSRGGVLSAVGGVVVLLAARKGKLSGLVGPALMGVFLIAMASGRMGSMTPDDASSRGRIEAWSEALAMFRQAPILGVGKGNFTDHHNLTAHNSFYLVLGEMGVVGTFFFQAIFWLPTRNFYRLVFSRRPSPPPTLIYACGAGLIAVMVSMFFLSRAYVLMAFIPVAMWVAQGSFQGGRPTEPFFEREDLGRYAWETFRILLGSIVLAYLLVKVLI